MQLQRGHVAGPPALRHGPEPPREAPYSLLDLPLVQGGLLEAPRTSQPCGQLQPHERGGHPRHFGQQVLDLLVQVGDAIERLLGTKQRTARPRLERMGQPGGRVFALGKGERVDGLVCLIGPLGLVWLVGPQRWRRRSCREHRDLTGAPRGLRLLLLFRVVGDTRAQKLDARGCFPSWLQFAFGGGNGPGRVMRLALVVGLLGLVQRARGRLPNVGGPGLVSLSGRLSRFCLVVPPLRLERPSQQHARGDRREHLADCIPEG